MRQVIKEVDVEGVIAGFDLIPYGQRLVVVEKEVEQVGRLFVPETAKDREMATNEGWVVAVGNDVDFCSPGDVIYYGRYSGAKFERGEMRYRIMNEDDILGRVVMKGAGKEEEAA
jgi:chaperonin GroES